jgi:hypothetical protein
LKVVRASHDPVLARHEATGTDGHIGELKRLDRRARFVGPDVYVAAVERREDPWLYCPSAENSLNISCSALPCPCPTEEKNRTYQSGESRCP